VAHTEANNRKAAYELAFAKLNVAISEEENTRAGGSPEAIATAERATAEMRANVECVREEMEASGDEEMVVLVSPNRHTLYVKDCHGVEFRYGRAVAPRSLANHCIDILDGYAIEEWEEDKES